MKTVPSLVASSTIGIAAAGLAFGRPEHSSSVRPTSRKRKASIVINDVSKVLDLSSPVSRPATSSTVITPETRQFGPGAGTSSGARPNTFSRPPTAKNDSNNNVGGRRYSMIQNGEFSPLHIMGEEPRRDSLSSRGSWIRRLSIIPVSASNSPRSSVGPDSPSITFSHGSAAPILSNPSSSPAQLPPNKLVKRTTSGKAVTGSFARAASQSQVPTLRRPATSHQRSITLQQKFKEQSAGPSDHVLATPPKRDVQSTPASNNNSPESRITWRPFFMSRPTKLTKERTSARSSDGGTQNFHSTSRRVLPEDTVIPTLVKPGVIAVSKTSYTAYYDEDSLPVEDEVDDEVAVVDEKVIPTTEVHPAELEKRPRRSLSMHFSSPSSWVSRSGSLRGSKRTGEGRAGGKRYSSAPATSLPGRKITSAGGPTHNGHRAITDPTFFQRQPLALNPSQQDPFVGSISLNRSRNTSSPLPPLSRLSSFNVDLARLGLSSSSSSQPNTSSTPLSSPGQYHNSVNAKPARNSEAVTLVDSEPDTKAFILGDDDDLDFQSETVFDSLRSGATGSVRSRNTPLESMFDESPQSLSSTKNKRLSIHELMASDFREGNRIVEEDEGSSSTPGKGFRSSQEREAGFQTPVRKHTMESEKFPSPPSYSLATKDLSRLSLGDEEEDEDWTRDDEDAEIQQLSPPSSFLNSHRVSASVRAALADVTQSPSHGNSAPSAERPKSNLFDWSEPSSAEKLGYNGDSPRPKTAHVKQIADGRGGRTVGRRGPSALHIRSQSVPVVPDVAGQRENSKLTPKFGTWGLGAKGVSEEWDGDFDFGIDNNGAVNEDDEMDNSAMIVPPAIQASQENVVGHVGQIREVCLLVEDLKRLRLLAREKNLLTGPSADMWKEAEGIIALAVPDEEDPTLSPPHSPNSVLFGGELLDEKYVGSGPDAEYVSRPDAPFELLDRHGKPTGIIYDGNRTRRRSMFSPDDEVFGGGPVLQYPQTRGLLQPPSAQTSPRASSMKASSDYARSVMQTMHQTRSTSDPLLGELTRESPNKMPFDTTSLRDLVHRASVLRTKLSDLIRKSDNSQSPHASPKRESSPAFTRVFTPDPMASSPKRLGRSQSNNSMLSGSIDASPSRSLGSRMHMMTVV